jgi:4'-phosphopantetheinyl transferase
MERLTTEWLSPPEPMDLQPHQVDVWRISLDREPASVNYLESTLSTDESQRATRFRFAANRDRFIVAHGSLRNILSEYLGCEPKQLHFSTNEYGKPVLEDHKLDFNLSHSGDYALVAVTREHKVGVDVEIIRSDMEHEKLARRFFSPNEVAELTTLPSDQIIRGFFNCWSRKEAYIKAQGLGLSLPLASFDVSLKPNEPATLRATRPNPDEAARWTLVSLEVSSAYAGALAVEGQGLSFRFWDWKPETITQ